VLQTLLPREGLQGLPLYTLGASAGGSFALVLPHFVPVAGGKVARHMTRYKEHNPGQWNAGADHCTCFRELTYPALSCVFPGVCAQIPVISPAHFNTFLSQPTSHSSCSLTLTRHQVTPRSRSRQVTVG